MDKLFTQAAKGIGFAVLFVVFATPTALLTAFPVMLALGVLHNDVSPAVPALGYWATAIVTWGTAAAIAHVRTSRKMTK